MNRKTMKRGLVPYIFLILLMLGVLYFMNVLNQKVNVLTYDELMTKLSNGEVTEVLVTPKERASIYEIRGSLKDYEENESFYVRIPLSDPVMNTLIEAYEGHNFTF